MTREQIAGALTSSLLGLGVEPEEIRPDVRLREDLELDSTEMVQVALDMTRSLGVRVKVQPKFDVTFQDLCEAVVDQTGGAT
jgi:acyl carrier protein